MVKKVTILLCFVILTSCGGVDTQSAEQPSQVANNIPLPNNNSTVDPNVSALFQKTVSELRADMDNPKLWMVHGSALFANGYYAESADALGRAIAINPEMPQATYLMATALWRANKQEEAIATLTLALELMPQYDIGWRLLAEWHLNRGETTLAEQAARKAFELQPRRIGTRYVLCQALMDDGKYDEAVVLLEQVISKDRAAPWIYKLAENCYRQLGENEKRESALAKAGPPFEDWPDPMFKHIPTLIAGKSELTEYALHLFKTAGSEKAKPFLLRAFKINPESTDLRVALSIALQDVGQLQQSRQILEELAGEPNMNYWKQYAGVCIATGELDKAKEYVANALALDPTDPNAHDIAAAIALKQKDTNSAAMHWAQAGKLYNEVEKWNKAEMSLAYAVQNGASGSEVLQSLALAQIKLDHTLQAKISIKKLLEKNPSDTVALELQSMLPQE